MWCPALTAPSSSVVEHHHWHAPPVQEAQYAQHQQHQYQQPQQLAASVSFRVRVWLVEADGWFDGVAVASDGVSVRVRFPSGNERVVDARNVERLWERPTPGEWAVLGATHPCVSAPFNGEWWEALLIQDQGAACLVKFRSGRECLVPTVEVRRRYV